MLAKVLPKSASAREAKPFAAFVADDDARAVSAKAAEQLGHVDPLVVVGGVADAVGELAKIPTPRLLVIDLSGSPDPLAAITSLAEVCDEGTRVVAIGDINDVDLYRKLIAIGVQDYLVKPIAAEILAESVTRAQRQPQAPEPEPVAHPQGRIMAFVGARGGVGCSTVAVNCAWLLAHEQGVRTALVDLDLHFGTCALALDLEPGHGFREALENPARIDGLFIERAMVRESDQLSVLGAEEGLENAFSFDPAALALLLDHLRRDFQCVILDLPRFAARSQLSLLTPPMSVVVVSDPSLAGMRDTMRLVGLTKKNAPKAEISVAVNRMGASKEGELSKGDFERGAELKVDFAIPYDPKPIAAATSSGKPLAKVAKSAKAVAALRSVNAKLHCSQGKVVKLSTWQRLFKKG